MGWFDEQIKERKINDERQFEGAFAHMASAIMGSSVLNAYTDSKTLTKNAITDVLKSFHLKPGRVPERVEDPEEQLEYMLRPHGIMYRRVVLTTGWYKDAQGPMIARRLDDGSATALLQDGMGRYYFKDTREGRTRQIDSSTAKLFDEEAICFYRPFPLKSLSVSDFLKYMLKTVTFKDQVS